MKNAGCYAGIVPALFMVTSLVMGQTEAVNQDKGTVPDTTKAAKEIKPIPYPLDYCIVSGEKLGAMGDPVVKVYNGRKIKFCCNMCPKTFEKNQAKYLKKLDNAIAAAAEGKLSAGNLRGQW